MRNNLDSENRLAHVESLQNVNETGASSLSSASLRLDQVVSQFPVAKSHKLSDFLLPKMLSPSRSAITRHHVTAN